MKRWLPQIFASLALISIGWFLHSLSPSQSTGPTRSRGMMSQNDRGGSNRGGAPGYGIVTAKQQEVVPVEVTSSLLAVIRERIRSSGILEPEREVVFLSRVEGTIDSVAVEEGAKIKEGSVLCSIDQEELRIATQVSAIELQQAKASLDRLEGLAETRSATGQEVENARFAHQKAKASHDRALIDLGHSQPKALFDGVIIRRRIEPGQYVRVGDELFAFADFEPLRVRLYLPESEVTDVEIGQRCVLRTESDGPILAEGTISRISPVVDRASLTVEILVSFPDAAVTLRPGSFVHVDIITRILDNRIVIPRKALLDLEGRSVVFRLLEDGETVQEIEVVPGYENETVVVIEEGLSIGDRIVVQGLDDLRDRNKVSVYREIPVEVDSLTVQPLESSKQQTSPEKPEVKTESPANAAPGRPGGRGPGGQRPGARRGSGG